VITEKVGAELKAVFREGWSNRDRVENWVNRVTRGQFDNAACRAAWKAALRAAAPPRRGTSTLDVGTGPGTIAQLWAEIGCHSTGLDFSPTMIAAGRRLAAAKSLPIAFIEGDAEDPPFPTGTFDVISSRLMLFTLPNPGLAIRRWVQLLKPGGRMVLVGEEMPPDAGKQLKKPVIKPGLKWKPGKRYGEALQQLPFRSHTAGTLSVVMAAAGLREIHRVPMKAVVHARRRLGKERVFPSTPYILVGRKEP
jgi:ubiquinone/menaquinone biosynthesis C-methylase UbiE